MKKRVRILKKIGAVAGGNFFTTKFFLRRIPEIVVLAILAFFYIDNKNYCSIFQKFEIQRLEQEIQELKIESLQVERELTQISILSNIEKMVNKRGLDIKIADKKYVIKINESTDN